MTRSAEFEILNESWSVRGLTRAEIGCSTGDSTTRDRHDVVVETVCTPEAPELAGDIGVRRTGREFILQAENFRVRISSGLQHIDVRASADGLIGAVHAGVRLAAILRCTTRRGGAALHSSAVLWNERAFAFCGPTGAGKSTAAQSASATLDAPTIADDLVLFRRQASGWVADGLPWERRAQEARAPFPVAGILRISQGAAMEIVRVTGAHAAAGIMAMLPVVLQGDGDDAVSASTDLASDVPVFRLVLPPDPAAVARAVRAAAEHIEVIAG